MHESASDHWQDVNKLLRLLVDHAKEHAIFLIDTDYRIRWWSGGAERVFRLPSAQAVGMPLANLFTRTDQASGVSALEPAIADSDAISEDDRWHVRADGSTFWSSGALIAIRDEHGEVLAYGKVLRDRTDIKEQLELLRRQLVDAQQRNTAQDRVITKISHELRNVLMGLDSGLAMVRSEESNRSRRTEVIELMQQQIHVVQRLTEDLLDAKRLQTGKATLSLQPTVLQSVLSEVIGHLCSRVEQKSQDLQLLTASAPILVEADPIRLHQIFANLIDNAIKYTPQHGRIWVKATLEDLHAVVHIEDTGSGIPPEMLTRIFEMFTQVDSTESGNGLGIGLALVNELVQLHGGSVQAVSKGIGMGSEFTVRLPLQSPRQPSQPSAA